jgi:hypothetical protein
MEDSTFILAPYVVCKHAQRSDDTPCPLILLPYPNLKATGWEGIAEEETNLPDWPADGWSALFGCSECGFVSEYFYLDVEWGLIPKSTPGRYHSGADCFCIEFQCAQKSCKASTKLHVQKNGLTESAVRDLFCRPFFIGFLPCGHEVRSLPASGYKIHEVVDQIE